MSSSQSGSIAVAGVFDSTTFAAEQKSLPTSWPSKERQYLGIPPDLPTMRLGDWVPV